MSPSAEHPHRWWHPREQWITAQKQKDRALHGGDMEGLAARMASRGRPGVDVRSESGRDWGGRRAHRLQFWGPGERTCRSSWGHTPMIPALFCVGFTKGKDGFHSHTESRGLLFSQGQPHLSWQKGPAAGPRPPLPLPSPQTPQQQQAQGGGHGGRRTAPLVAGLGNVSASERVGRPPGR